MPRYDYGCEQGHVHEVVAGRDCDTLPCATCGAIARRQITTAPLINGGAIPPMRERRMPVTDWRNALDEGQVAARKQGKELSDVWREAKHAAKHIQKHAPELIDGT